MVRGYEVAKGQYMIVEDEELEAVQIESTRTSAASPMVGVARQNACLALRGQCQKKS
jgi:non-homologous end joining protein Ku